MVPQVFLLKKKALFDKNRFSVYGQLAKNLQCYLVYSYQIIKPFNADNILLYLVYVKNSCNYKAELFMVLLKII